MKLAFPAPNSPSGKVYQYSPNPEALPRLFLIGEGAGDRREIVEQTTAMRRKPGPGQTVCPYSGHMDDDDAFVHFDDIRVIKKRIEQLAAADVQDHIADMARDFNRRQKSNGFIDIKMSVQPSVSVRRSMPLAIRQDLLRDIQCNHCGRAYAVYAISLYCPDCGATNIAQHFQRELDIVHAQIKLTDTPKNNGNAELAYRLLGNAHEDVLTAYEATLKSVYKQARQLLASDDASVDSNIGNAFQNIERTRKLFGELSIDPFSDLSENELARMSLFVQKRHVVGHNLGVADEPFASKTGTSVIGRTVELVAEEVKEFGELCRRVVMVVEPSIGMTEFTDKPAEGPGTTERPA